jgi:hypothetical protein
MIKNTVSRTARIAPEMAAYRIKEKNVSAVKLLRMATSTARQRPAATL